MILLNATDLCEGRITRSREACGKLENSSIDLIVVCEKLFSHIMNMKIDEKKVYGLTNFSNKKKGIHAKQSNHNPIYIDLTLNYEKEQDDRKNCLQIQK